LARIIYNADTLKLISIFEGLTGAKVKDLLPEEKPTFIVEKGQMGLAIGRGGSNLKRVERAMKKQVKVIEFDEDITKFIRNYVFPINKIEVKFENKLVEIKGQDTKTRAFLIGRDKSNLKRMISVVKRFFDIDDISVV